MNKSSFNPLKVTLGAIKNITAAVKGRHLAFAAIVAIFPTVAVATPSEGIVSGTIFARGAFADPTDITFKIKGTAPCNPRSAEVIRAKDAQDTVIQQIVIAPGGTTGWHSHPGPVVVVVQAGELSFYDGDDPTCTVRTYSAGQVFVDSGQGHVHIARNQGSVNLELWATYFDVPPVDPSVPGSGAFRIDAPAPGNCSF